MWIALSDLFLDTELQEYNFVHIVNTIRESVYKLDEAEEILMLEVFPICIPSLHSVAGEWNGFYEDWVCKSIISAKRPNRYSRWINRRRFWMIKNVWDKVVGAYKQL